MKKLNLKFITPFVLTLIIQGCMPHSLTKFSKDAPKKTSASASTTPVVDTSGAVVAFAPPTIFYYYNVTTKTYTGVVGTALSSSELAPTIDGTLGDSTLRSKFVTDCALDVTGNAQTRVLPPGLHFDRTTCAITGTPIAIKSVSTAFCSDPAYATQTACETASLTWNATTLKCSNPDYQYATATACTTAKNKWYKVGSHIPYRMVLSFHDEYYVASTISTTINIGAYQVPVNLNFTQPDRLLLTVAPLGGSVANITPITTTTAAAVPYDRSSIISGEKTAAGIAKFVDTSLNKIGINKLVALYVSNVAPFAVDGFITVFGDSTTIGKIVNIDSIYSILYIENISAHNKYFSTGAVISNNTFGTVSSASIVEVDDTYAFSDLNIDNDSQFYSTKFSVANTSYVYETGLLYPIKPIRPFGSDSILSTSGNGLTYKISPALPPGLSFDNTTGIISGYFAGDFATNQFTITATNILGSVSNTIYLTSITAPKDYNLSNKEIITVSNTAFFREGEDLYQSITPPALGASRGKILKILNNYQMAIETYNGDFLAGASLDSGSSYTDFTSEKAYIIPDKSCVNPSFTTKAACEGAAAPGPYVWSQGVAFYNLALTLNTTGGYTAGSYITNAAGAKALVVAVYTAARDILFVQWLTDPATGVSTALKFYEDDLVNSGATIYQVDNNNMTLTLADATNFLQGVDVITNGGTGAYTHESTLITNTISVSDVTKTPTGTLFKKGDIIYNDERVSGALNTTIINVTHDNLFAVERGKLASFHGNIGAATGITYSITPSLPTGLSLNTATGAITGTPTIATPRKNFLITATNFISSTTFATSIEVRDYFQIADKSNTSSFLLHKVGDSQINRKCRINANDILNATSAKALDIRCFLDGEEEDIYFNKIAFNGLSGPGVCQYVQYAPFYFEQFSPVQSVKVSSKYQVVKTVNVGCGTDSPPTANDCESNYTSPNCDEGYLEYKEQLLDPSTCAPVGAPTTKTVSCGGAKSNCISGPIRQLLTDAQIKAGSRSMVYSAANKLDRTWTQDAPIDNGYLSNMSVANGSINNQCFTNNADVNTWTTKMGLTQGTVSPLGMGTTRNQANPYYVFNCLDSAMEIKARIRIVVRDWDRSFRINDGIDNQTYLAPAAKMNDSTLDPTFNVSYNSYSDWDDNYSGPGTAATFTGGSCGVHVAGSCVTAPYRTQAICEYNGGVWAAGTCNLSPTYIDQYSCLLNGEAWVGDEEYKFPGGNL